MRFPDGSRHRRCGTVERGERDVPRPEWIGADVEAVVDERKEATVVVPSVADEPDLIAYLARLRVGRGRS